MANEVVPGLGRMAIRNGGGSVPRKCTIESADSTGSGKWVVFILRSLVGKSISFFKQIHSLNILNIFSSRISNDELHAELSKVSTPAGYIHARTGMPALALSYCKSRLVKMKDKVSLRLGKSQLCIYCKRPAGSVTCDVLNWFTPITLHFKKKHQSHIPTLVSNLGSQKYSPHFATGYFRNIQNYKSEMKSHQYTSHTKVNKQKKTKTHPNYVSIKPNCKFRDNLAFFFFPP